MQGSVIKYEGKRGVTWTYVIDAGRDASGKRVQKWRRGFPTKKAAEAAMQAFRDPEHLGRACHLQIEHGSHGCAQSMHVVVLHVAAVFSQMRRNAVCARVLALGRGENRVGLDGSACLAQRRDVVDVNVKSLVHSG